MQCAASGDKTLTQRDAFSLPSVPALPLRLKYSSLTMRFQTAFILGDKRWGPRTSQETRTPHTGSLLVGNFLFPPNKQETPSISRQPGECRLLQPQDTCPPAEIDPIQVNTLPGGGGERGRNPSARLRTSWIAVRTLPSPS